jgi:hypothetical protein
MTGYKKFFLAVSVFFLILPALYGQNMANFLTQLDGAVKTLGTDMHGKLSAEKAQKVVLGRWTRGDSIPPLGDYWQVQLMEELTNIPGRSYSLSSAGPAGADWMVSGEIIEIVNVIRIYTRFTRLSDNSIQQIIHSDFERNEYLAEMLSGGGGSGGSSQGGSRDSYEPDSQDNPLSVTIASQADGPLINRTLHNGGDEDFFLLVPETDGPLVMETTGNIDTYLEFYDASSMEQVSTNDDGGSGNNARIRYNVRAGNRYIAKVRGYSSSETGSYGFRAYIIEQVRLNPDEYEDDNEFTAAKDISIGASQERTFHSGGDIDWIRFQVERPGRYVIRARGLRSNRLDTYIELYDSGNNYIDDNDDGGEDLDSRLSVQLQSGTYYIKAECLNDEPDQPYVISVEAG